MLELRSPPLRIYGTMRRLPILAVINPPFASEPFLVAVLHPELRFLQVYRFGTGIQCPLNAHAQKFSIVRSRAHVVYVASVAVRGAVPVRLLLVLMVHAVEPALDVILVRAPGDASHDVNAVAVLAPGRAALGEVGRDACK